MRKKFEAQFRTGVKLFSETPVFLTHLDFYNHAIFSIAVLYQGVIYNSGNTAFNLYKGVGLKISAS